MNTRYYLGWFNNGFNEKLVDLLNEDIMDRKSLVMISANRLHLKGEIIGDTERSWLDHANIIFEEYNLIDYGLGKEKAQKLIENASVIFLLGGNVVEQNDLLFDYELLEKIRMSRAIVLGTSAGAINMSAKWMLSKFTGYKSGIHTIYNGVGFDDFSVLSHFDLENNIDHIQSELSPILKEVKVYASNKDCAIRVKKGTIDILGDVYLISKLKVQKLDETI